MTQEELKRDRDALTDASHAIARAATHVDDLDVIRSAQVAVANVSESLDRLVVDVRARRAAQVSSLTATGLLYAVPLTTFWRGCLRRPARCATAIGDLFGTRVFLDSLAMLCDGLLRKAKRGAFAFNDFDRLVENVARTDNIPLSDVKSPMFKQRAQSSASKS